MLTQRAPAKINLYLHITGRREDGYHLIDSLAVFARNDAAADSVTLEESARYELTIGGPYGEALQQEDPELNLITRALRIYAQQSGKPLDFALHLEKNLPVASGIGGGSADAAAALRAAARFHGLAPDHPALLDAAKGIGADGMVCLRAAPAFMRGIGDELVPAIGLPRAWLLLANPNIPLPTAPVYRARQGAFTPAMPFEKMPADAAELAAMLAARRNDLEAPALSLCPPIQDVLDVLAAQPDCLLARLSGSGATCFGLFAGEDETRRAYAHIKNQIGEWWLAAAAI